jgi:uncharacterized protein YwqG
MDQNEILKQLAPWRERHVRFTWKPVVSESDGPATASKFSGIPWLAPGEQWPVCVGCQRPLQLFLQLNLNDLPEELCSRFGDGLLQLFYCVDFDCDRSGDAWQPFAQPTVVRVVVPTGHERTDVTVPPNHFPPQTIVRWEIDSDFPSAEEHRALGLIYEYDFNAKSVTVRWPEVGLQLENLEFETADLIANPHVGDKLSGWPYWIQSAEYPSCPQCGKQMELVFQIDSEDNLPFMFGDTGCGHITQCPHHKDVVAFGWACY